MRNIVNTANAPTAIGIYSQAVKAGNTYYLAGQIALDPTTQMLVDGDVKVQAIQIFKNIQAVCEAAGGSLNHIIKLTVYVKHMADMASVNDVMAAVFQAPFPARTAIGVNELPKNALVEVEALMFLDD